jgi:hypothetical protein
VGRVVHGAHCRGAAAGVGWGACMGVHGGVGWGERRGRWGGDGGVRWGGGVRAPLHSVVVGRSPKMPLGMGPCP